MNNSTRIIALTIGFLMFYTTFLAAADTEHHYYTLDWGVANSNMTETKGTKFENYKSQRELLRGISENQTTIMGLTERDLRYFLDELGVPRKEQSLALEAVRYRKITSWNINLNGIDDQKAWFFIEEDNNFRDFY